MSDARSGSTYRADLDGLRAVAVLSVMLFHLGLRTVKGGFVGVDIFFVLSGYFITSQIAGDIQQHNFSLLRFYERRIRRIVPALIFVLVICTVFAVCFLLPDELITYLKTLLAAAFSVSNIYFFTQDAYFGPKAQTQLLLHTWSLGVEEQFYIVYPIFMAAAIGAGRRSAILLVWGIAIASLAACILISLSHERAAFFWLPTRMWQLLCGGVIALGFVPQATGRWLKETAALIGAAAITASVLYLGPDIKYPGAYALAPTVGAALIIWSGTHKNTLIARLLETQPLPFIGLISYSLYLWHWPLIVSVHLWSPGEFSNGQQIIVIAVVFALAGLSWRYVEQPFRRKPGIVRSRAGVFAWNGLSLAAISAVVLAGLAGNGWPARFSKETLELADAANDVSPVRKLCHFETKDPGPLDKSCRLGSPNDPSIVVFGDSHGIELSFALSKLAKFHHQSVREFTTSGCPSVLNFSATNTPRCSERNATVTRLLSSLQPTTILLAAGWEKASSTAPARDTYLKGLAAVLDRLHRAGHRLFLIGTAPSQPDGMPIPQTLARHRLLGEDPEAYRFPEDIHRLQSDDRSAEKFATSHGAEYLPFSPLLCDKAGCRGVLDGKPLYFDSAHLSNAGATFYAMKVVAPALWP